ncbi:MAG: hypothetical protein M0014_01930 [Actinomycetota bacterium]|jgi:hypothetical protein|nr:hypothetical protein [Actinomycetota bacterium]
MEGPVVQVGQAVLDRLAVDQLQVGTAPWLFGDDGFSWLPGPFVQTVAALPMRPSRQHEITDVAVRTELGRVPADQRARARQILAELSDELPVCAPMLAEDGELQLVSSFTIHEGVWWHRCELLAIAAPLQLHAADTVMAALTGEGIGTDLASPTRTLLGEREDSDERDGIYEVIPDLLLLNYGREVSAADVAAAASTRLLQEPYSRLFGDLGSDPDVVVLARDLDDDGGWDPPIGEVMVMFTVIDQDLAGESLRITVHPGFPPGGDDLIEAASWLTRFTHSQAGFPLAPSWRLLNATVGPTVVLR